MYGTFLKHSSTVLSNSRDYRLCRYRTVRSDLSRRTGRSLAPQAKPLQARLFANALGPPPTLSSPSAVRITKETATNALLRCHGLASHATCRSAASALRLSGNPPDSQSGGAIRLKPSRRAGCEGAQRSRGSHAASLKEGLGWVHVEKCASLVLGFLPRAFSQGAYC